MSKYNDYHRYSSSNLHQLRSVRYLLTDSIPRHKENIGPGARFGLAY